MQRTISTIVQARERDEPPHAEETSWPSLISLPSDGLGGWIPNPRKESAASVRIAIPTIRVRVTTIGPTAFGSMCRNMMRRSPEPAAFAASTYSFSAEREEAPADDAGEPGQKSKARMNADPDRVARADEGRGVSSTASPGKVRIRSVKRIRMLSTQPL